ncbi:MAG: hypothetical protein AAF737_04165 [Pseudomonadota bacterium]
MSHHLPLQFVIERRGTVRPPHVGRAVHSACQPIPGGGYVPFAGNDSGFLTVLINVNIASEAWTACEHIAALFLNDASGITAC